MATTSLPLLFFHLFFLLSAATHHRAALPEKSPPISSTSILIGLLDSRYTQLSELLEKSLLLQPLEEAVTKHNITIFAPDNEALDSDLSLDFKRFLLEPGNINSLQTLLLHHILPVKFTAGNWPADSTRYAALSHDHLEFSCHPTSAAPCSKYVGDAEVVRFNDVVRRDGIVHGVRKLIVPKSVEREFNNRRNLRTIAAVKPEAAPEFESRAKKFSQRNVNSVQLDAAPELSVHEALAPAPGPGVDHRHFDGEKQVNDFIQTMLHYGGYNEMTDILVNLTNLATEIGKLVDEGYVLTVLAPSDEAISKLTADQLSEPGAPEQIVYYHIVPEYQTEESMYNAVRRFGTVSYGTLRLPHKLVATDADGSVKFGEGENSGYLFDPDIYADGRILVQGIDGVLFPLPEEKKKKGVLGFGAAGRHEIEVVLRAQTPIPALV
ncbi:hypothetical protein ACS0TY_000817 [Phlomoides rotata]